MKMVEQVVQSPSSELFNTWPHVPKQCCLSSESALLRLIGWAGDFLRSLPAWISVWSSDPKVQPTHNQGCSLFSSCLLVSGLFIWLCFYLHFGDTEVYFHLLATLPLWICDTARDGENVSEDKQRGDSNCCSWDRHEQWEPEVRGEMTKAWARILILETHISDESSTGMKTWQS